MQNIKAEFFSRTDAYNAIGAIRNLCIRVEIESEEMSDRNNKYLSNLNLRHEFFNAGVPSFMSSNIGFPQFNSITWGSMGMNGALGGGYDEYNSGFSDGVDESVTVLNIESDDENLPKLKSKLYSEGAVAVFNSRP